MNRALVFYGINCCVAHCIGNNSIEHSEKTLEGFRSRLQGFKNCKFKLAYCFTNILVTILLPFAIFRK